MTTRSAVGTRFVAAAFALAISTVVLPESRAAVVCDSDGPAGTPYVRGVNCRTIVINGYDREFLVYVSANPAFDLADPFPLVVALHGGGGTAGNMLHRSGWQERSDSRGVVVIFGQALEYFSTEKNVYTNLWNAYGVEDEVDPNLPPPGYPSGPPADDIAYLRGAVDDVDTMLNIDDEAVFVTGFSNGGRMCMRAAVQMSDRFKAAGCFAGALNEVPTDIPLARIPIMFARGASDPNAINKVNQADSPTPPLSELPLTWAEVEDLPSLVAQITPNLETFGLSGTPTSMHEGSRKMVVRFQAPADPNDPDVSCLHYVHLEGVEHEYPNGTNNPDHGFNAARKFGKFFVNTPVGC